MIFDGDDLVITDQQCCEDDGVSTSGQILKFQRIRKSTEPTSVIPLQVYCTSAITSILHS